jgi:cathepsin F
MKFLLIALLICVVCTFAAKQDTEKFVQTQFESFKVKFMKNYKSNDEERMRFRIFKSNLKRIAKLNAESLGQNNYGITKFADLTPSEFSHMYLMPHRPLPEIRDDQVLDTSNLKNITLPAAWDWRKDGLRGGQSCITAVYNQGQCGSCWAFSATEETESMDFLQGNAGAEPYHLSIQQVVDCDTQAYGCDGGWTYVAYEYIMKAGGYDSGASYPYTAQDGTCKFDKSHVQARITGWKYVTSTKDEAVMKQFIGTTGPASICVDASSWQFYNGGVIKSCGKSIDHCVHLVGYDKVDGVEAWVVRNSWGTSWGINGYLYLEYGKDTCAMAQVVTTVTTAR